MNCFGKREGQFGKQSPRNGENAIQNNDADVAELVDARDLKSLPPSKIIDDFWKTQGSATMETHRTKPDLENDYSEPWERRAAWAKSIVANMQPFIEPDRSVPAINDDHVYLAYSAGRIKIGTSMDVGTRKRGLNTQSPHPVTIILTVPGDCELERRLHFCLGSVRVHGEWFKITPEMRQLLAASLCRTGLRKFKKAEAAFRKWVRTEYAGI